MATRNQRHTGIEETSDICIKLKYQNIILPHNPFLKEKYKTCKTETKCPEMNLKQKQLRTSSTCL